MESANYTSGEWKRYGAMYSRLLDVIKSGAPDAAGFKRALDKALAGGFPVDFLNYNDRTLLEWTEANPQAVRAGLPQILIAAGADVNKRNEAGGAALDTACRQYIYFDRPEYLPAIDVLLSAGARPEFCKGWKEGWTQWTQPEMQARAARLKAYINTWPERRAAAARRAAAPGFDYAL